MAVIRGGDTGPAGGGKAPGCFPVRRRVSKLVKRKMGECDAGIGFGSCLALLYQVVAVVRLAEEARALKAYWISFL